MAITTAAGSKLAISAGIPTAQTNTAYKTLTYTSIGGVESIGGIGPQTEVVTFQPLDGPMEKYKGPTNYGQLQPTIALNDADAGQTLLTTASAPENIGLYAYRVVKPDGTVRYFQGRSFGIVETIGAANSMITAQPTIEICTAVIKDTAV